MDNNGHQILSENARRYLKIESDSKHQCKILFQMQNIESCQIVLIVIAKDCCKKEMSEKGDWRIGLYLKAAKNILN